MTAIFVKGIGFLSLFVALLLPMGCGDSGAYDAAQALERQVLVANPSATYADPGYLRVAEKLSSVPRTSTDFAESQLLLKRIQDARRVALQDVRGLDYGSERLDGLSLKDLGPKKGQTVGAQPIAEPVQVAKSKVEKAEQGKAVVGEHEVILYSTSWCGYCRKARSYFTRNDIPFVEKDIEKDRQAGREMRVKVGGRSGVPVIDIDGHIIRGYNLTAIKKALKD